MNPGRPSPKATILVLLYFQKYHRRALLQLLFWSALLMPFSVSGFDFQSSTKADSTTIDSLMNLSWTLARSNPGESILLLKKIEDIQKAKNISYNYDRVLYYYGVFYKNLNQFADSEVYLDRYLAFHEKTGKKNRIAAVNMAKANLYSDQNLWDKSMAAAKKSLSLYEELKDTNGILIATSKLGYLLVELKRVDDGLFYHRKSLATSYATGDSIQMAIALNNIALSFEKAALLDSAEIYYRSNLEMEIDRKSVV